MLMKESANFKEGGQTKFRWWERAVGIKCLHIDDEGSFGEAFGFEEYLCIWKSRMEGHQSGIEEGIKHGLDTRAVGGFLRGGAGIGQQ